MPLIFQVDRVIRPVTNRTLQQRIILHFELLILSAHRCLLIRQQSLVQNASVEAVIISRVCWERARITALVGARLAVLHLTARHHLVVAVAHLLVTLHVVDAVRA